MPLLTCRIPAPSRPEPALSVLRARCKHATHALPPPFSGAQPQPPPLLLRGGASAGSGALRCVTQRGSRRAARLDRRSPCAVPDADGAGLLLAAGGDITPAAVPPADYIAAAIVCAESGRELITREALLERNRKRRRRVLVPTELPPVGTIIEVLSTAELVKPGKSVRRVSYGDRSCVTLGGTWTQPWQTCAVELLLQQSDKEIAKATTKVLNKVRRMHELDSEAQALVMVKTLFERWGADVSLRIATDDRYKAAKNLLNYDIFFAFRVRSQLRKLAEAALAAATPRPRLPGYDAADNATGAALEEYLSSFRGKAEVVRFRVVSEAEWQQRGGDAKPRQLKGG